MSATFYEAREGTRRNKLPRAHEIFTAPRKICLVRTRQSILSPMHEIELFLHIPSRVP